MQICGDPSDRYSQASGSSIKLLGGGQPGLWGCSSGHSSCFESQVGAGVGGVGSEPQICPGPSCALCVLCSDRDITVWTCCKPYLHVYLLH